MGGHAHHEESFISKYIFSHDHKMISKQFLVTAIVMGIIAVMLSVFFRLQLGWPGESFAILERSGKWAQEESWTETPTWPWSRSTAPSWSSSC